ncbi:hypothetical protein ACYATO_07605 [Lactobacillaceae bacterium Melli_B3]
MKFSKWMLVLLVPMVCGLENPTVVNAMTTRHQRRPAVTKLPRVKTVNNANITRGLPKEYSTGNYPQSGKLNSMRVTKGFKHVRFNTSFFYHIMATRNGRLLKVLQWLVTMLM